MRYKVSWLVAPDGTRAERIVSAPTPEDALGEVRWDLIREGKSLQEMRVEVAR